MLKNLEGQFESLKSYSSKPIVGSEGGGGDNSQNAYMQTTQTVMEAQDDMLDEVRINREGCVLLLVFSSSPMCSLSFVVGGCEGATAYTPSLRPVFSLRLVPRRFASTSLPLV